MPEVKRPSNSSTIPGLSETTEALVTGRPPKIGALVTGTPLARTSQEAVGDGELIDGRIVDLLASPCLLLVPQGGHDQLLGFLLTEHPTQRPSLMADLVLQ